MAEQNIPHRKTAIVTGGSSGIGLAIVKEFLNNGLTVFAGARRAQKPEVIERFETATDGKAVLQPLDVASTKSVEAFLASVQDAAGAPNILVNAAGIYAEAPVIGHSDALWEKMITTNLSGAFRMIRATLPGMKAQGWGRIVNIASVAAHQGMADNAAYCASKAGLLGLSRCVSLEGAAFGVTCTSISPTWVETEMMRMHIERQSRETGLSMEEQMQQIQSATPQGVLVQPEEVAKLAAFLVSDAARPITMEDIQINAGALW